MQRRSFRTNSYGQGCFQKHLISRTTLQPCGLPEMPRPTVQLFGRIRIPPQIPARRFITMREQRQHAFLRLRLIRQLLDLFVPQLQFVMMANHNLAKRVSVICDLVPKQGPVGGPDEGRRQCEPRDCPLHVFHFARISFNRIAFSAAYPAWSLSKKTYDARRSHSRSRLAQARSAPSS